MMKNIYVVHKARALQRKFRLVNLKLKCKHTIFTKNLQFMAHEIYVRYKQINIHVSYPHKKSINKNFFIRLTPVYTCLMHITDSIVFF